MKLLLLATYLFPTASMTTMDAANYITTLDHIAPKGDRPKSLDYAIVDLAVDHDFLKFLYEGMQREPIEWWCLFEGTNWQACWSKGPILVDLCNNCLLYTSPSPRDGLL